LYALNIQVSQGSAAAYLRRGGGYYSRFILEYNSERKTAAEAVLAAESFAAALSSRAGLSRVKIAL